VSFAFFVLFSAVAAVSVNMGIFIVFRLLVCGAAASVQSVGSGTVADVWEPKDCGESMRYLYAGSPVRPCPYTYDWRYPDPSFWLAKHLVVSHRCWQLMLALIIFCLTETVRKKVMSGEDKGPSLSSQLAVICSGVKPLRILCLPCHPAMFVAVHAAGIRFGVDVHGIR
jgi:hypothetical protein